MRLMTLSLAAIFLMVILTKGGQAVHGKAQSTKQKPGQSCVPGSTKEHEYCQASAQDPAVKSTPKQDIRVICGSLEGHDACCFNVYSGPGINSKVVHTDFTTLYENCPQKKNPCCQDKGAMCGKVNQKNACCFSAAHPNTGSCDPQYPKKVSKNEYPGYSGCCDDSKCVDGKCVKK